MERRTHDEVRERLEQERDRAIERLRELGISPELDETAPRAGIDTVLDEGDLAQASERLDISFMTRERLAARINRLTETLDRIAQGTYGNCSVCAGDIEAQRLAALPEADTCLRCQQEIERGPGIERAA